MCGCPLPFTHHKFPADAKRRKQWISLINRKNTAFVKKNWSPSKNAVVCSDHFVDKAPTTKHPLPTLNLGYQRHDSSEAGRRPNMLQSKNATNQPLMLSPQKTATVCTNSEDWLSTGNDSSSQNTHTVELDTLPDGNYDGETSIASPQLEAIEKKIQQLELKNFKQTLMLRSKTKQLLQLLGPVNKLLLKNDADALFYTGIPKLKIFHSLCSLLRRFEKVKAKPSKTVTMLLRIKYKRLPYTNLLDPKLGYEDQILMTLMKLRLGLLHKDLADRYDFIYLI